jgi:hypothetical protein
MMCKALTLIAATVTSVILAPTLQTKPLGILENITTSNAIIIDALGY